MPHQQYAQRFLVHLRLAVLSRLEVPEPVVAVSAGWSQNAINLVGYALALEDHLLESLQISATNIVCDLSCDSNLPIKAELRPATGELKPLAFWAYANDRGELNRLGLQLEKESSWQWLAQPSLPVPYCPALAREFATPASDERWKLWEFLCALQHVLCGTVSLNMQIIDCQFDHACPLIRVFTRHAPTRHDAELTDWVRQRVLEMVSHIEDVEFEFMHPSERSYRDNAIPILHRGMIDYPPW